MMHESDELTYVVLDVPDPQAASVMAIRKAHADLVRAALPVEITLTESFDPAQDPGQAFTALDDIAQEVTSIEASFAGAHRFPNGHAMRAWLRGPSGRIAALSFWANASGSSATRRRVTRKRVRGPVTGVAA